MAKKQQKIEEERDELGFTLDDYYDMQKLKDQDGKLNNTLSDGWDVTPEQITLINNPNHPLHRISVIAFYDVNIQRLCNMAYKALLYDKFFCLKTIVTYEDLTQQVFIDLLSGALKLPHDTEKITRIIYRCFRYAAVGGLEGVDNVQKLRTA